MLSQGSPFHSFDQCVDDSSTTSQNSSITQSKRLRNEEADDEASHPPSKSLKTPSVSEDVVVSIVDASQLLSQEVTTAPPSSLPTHLASTPDLLSCALDATVSPLYTHHDAPAQCSSTPDQPSCAAAHTVATSTESFHLRQENVVQETYLDESCLVPPGTIVFSCVPIGGFNSKREKSAELVKLLNISVVGLSEQMANLVAQFDEEQCRLCYTSPLEREIAELTGDIIRDSEIHMARLYRDGWCEYQWQLAQSQLAHTEAQEAASQDAHENNQYPRSFLGHASIVCSQDSPDGYAYVDVSVHQPNYGYSSHSTASHGNHGNSHDGHSLVVVIDGDNDETKSDDTELSSNKIPRPPAENNCDDMTSLSDSDVAYETATLSIVPSAEAEEEDDDYLDYGQMFDGEEDEECVVLEGLFCCRDDEDDDDNTSQMSSVEGVVLDLGCSCSEEECGCERFRLGLLESVEDGECDDGVKVGEVVVPLELLRQRHRGRRNTNADATDLPSSHASQHNASHSSCSLGLALPAVLFTSLTATPLALRGASRPPSVSSGYPHVHGYGSSHDAAAGVLSTPSLLATPRPLAVSTPLSTLLTSLSRAETPIASPSVHSPTHAQSASSLADVAMTTTDHSDAPTPVLAKPLSDTSSHAMPAPGSMPAPRSLPPSHRTLSPSRLGDTHTTTGESSTSSSTGDFALPGLAPSALSRARLLSAFHSVELQLDALCLPAASLPHSPKYAARSVSLSPKLTGMNGLNPPNSFSQGNAFSPSVRDREGKDGKERDVREGQSAAQRIATPLHRPTTPLHRPHTPLRTTPATHPHTPLQRVMTPLQRPATPTQRTPLPTLPVSSTSTSSTGPTAITAVTAVAATASVPQVQVELDSEDDGCEKDSKDANVTDVTSSTSASTSTASSASIIILPASSPRLATRTLTPISAPACIPLPPPPSPPQPLPPRLSLYSPSPSPFSSLFSTSPHPLPPPPPPPSARVPCMHGHACYRRNPQHKAQYAHPGDADWPSDTTTISAATDAGTGSRPSVSATGGKRANSGDDRRGRNSHAVSTTSRDTASDPVSHEAHMSDVENQDDRASMMGHSSAVATVIAPYPYLRNKRICIRSSCSASSASSTRAALAQLMQRTVLARGGSLCSGCAVSLCSVQEMPCNDQVRCTPDIVLVVGNTSNPSVEYASMDKDMGVSGGEVHVRAEWLLACEDANTAVDMDDYTL